MNSFEALVTADIVGVCAVFKKCFDGSRLSTIRICCVLSWALDSVVADKMANVTVNAPVKYAVEKRKWKL